jgi:hypothetical protein
MLTYTHCCHIPLIWFYHVNVVCCLSAVLVWLRTPLIYVSDFLVRQWSSILCAFGAPLPWLISYFPPLLEGSLCRGWVSFLTTGFMPAVP